MKYYGKENPYKVKAIWEVLLRKELVREICKARGIYQKTMSWVVRYCVFSLLREKVDVGRVQEVAESLKEKNQIDPKKSRELHRFKLCLYGEDEKLFLEMKMRYGITPTMLVRVALKLYLPRLLKKQVSPWEFFWYGIKFFGDVVLSYSGKKEILQVDLHVLRFLKLNDYWGVPPGPLPPFLCA